MIIIKSLLFRLVGVVDTNNLQKIHNMNYPRKRILPVLIVYNNSQLAEINNIIHKYKMKRDKEINRL